MVGLLISLPGSASAQTILGQVVDEVNGTPVGGAIVSLVDRGGARRAETLSDSTGHFTLTPPEAGEFFMEGNRFGYRATRSPLLSLATAGTASIELLMSPEPIGLDGFRVTVEVEIDRALQSFGLSPVQLGNRYVSRSDIDAIIMKRDMGTVLERKSMPGVRIIRPENQQPGSADLGLCVSLARARTGGGANTCALIVLNGVPIGGPQAIGIDPDAIESMAVLMPFEATTFYGTLGAAGALLVWTRTGG